MATPVGSEIPMRWVCICGSRWIDNSRNQTLNRANTKPRLTTATLVLIQARNVRSLARYSVARFVSSIVAWGLCFCICIAVEAHIAQLAHDRLLICRLAITTKASPQGRFG